MFADKKGRARKRFFIHLIVKGVFMKKVLFGFLLAFCAISFTAFAAQDGRPDRKKEKERVECCCKDCECRKCRCDTDCSKCAGCRRYEACRECRDCDHEGHCCDYRHRRHHRHRHGGCCGCRVEIITSIPESQRRLFSGMLVCAASVFGRDWGLQFIRRVAGVQVHFGGLFGEKGFDTVPIYGL